jgi:hypothetical protein
VIICITTIVCLNENNGLAGIAFQLLINNDYHN